MEKSVSGAGCVGFGVGFLLVLFFNLSGLRVC